MKRQRPIYQIKEDFLRKLSKNSIPNTVNQLKNEYDYNELILALPEILKLGPQFKSLIWGNLFPMDYSKLGVGNNYYYRSKCITNELNWILLQIAKHKRQMETFVLARDSVFRYLAIGEYDRVYYEIRKLEENIGVSVWSTEMKLMTNSLAGYEVRSFDLLTIINQAAENVQEKGKTGYVPLLSHFLFKRSSTQSASSYEDELAAIHKRNRNDFQVDRLKYYQFRLNYYADRERFKLDNLLIYESANSLVDKYMSMLNLFKLMFVGKEFEREIASNYACKLFGYVADLELTPFLAYQDVNKLPDTYFDADFINVLDSYYKKDYQNSIAFCKKYIKKNPNHFDCIKIYVHSLLFLKRDYSPIVSNADSVTNQVALLVYRSLDESDNTSALADLYDFNKTIYGLPLAAGIHCFIMGQRKENVDNYQKYLSLFSYDPLFSRVWKEAEKEKAIAYLATANEHGLSSITVNYYIGLLNDIYEGYPKDIAQYIVDRDIAKKQYAEKLYNQCISSCDKLFNEWGQYLSIGQMTSEYAFRSYVEKGATMEAISFYVNRYICKKSLVNSIQTNGFMEDLRRARYKHNVRNTIDLQIFVYLNASEEEQKAHVLQMFMNYLDARNMAGLIDAIKDDIQQVKQEIFLFFLVEGDILRHLPYIESTKQILEEQQIIIQYLTQLESSNHQLYESYNQQIIQLMISYENIKKLDASRIYVNEAAIIKYELSECENLYKQLVNRNQVTKSAANYLLLQASDDGVLGGVDAQLMQSGYKSTRNVTTDISTQIFNHICQKYLFSKFGLKTYLSTRIRHGVLEGEIRSVFDSCHLMLTTQNNRFTPIMYWKQTFGLSIAEQDRLMQKLGVFSSNLGQIIEDFKKEVVQIKTKEGELGMFDYALSDEKKSYVVNLAQSNAEDYDAFCSQMLLILNGITEQSLHKIREYIHEDFRKKFIRIIDQLENELQCMRQCHFYNDLLWTVSQSRESIQGTLVKIEKWFSLQTGVYSDFILEDQIRLVWDVTQRQYPNIKHNLDLSIESASFVVDASHYSDIADMLTIFFNNMFGHSKVETIRGFTISTKRDLNYVYLHFENRTSENDDSLNETFDELLKMDNRLQLEGRSGLAKVKKIVLYDLNGNEDDFSVIAENGICKVDVRLKINSLEKKEVNNE